MGKDAQGDAVKKRIKMRDLKVGDIFTLASPLPDEDANQKYVAVSVDVEGPDDELGRVLATALGTGFAYPPTSTFHPNDRRPGMQTDVIVHDHISAGEAEKIVRGNRSKKTEGLRALRARIEEAKGPNRAQVQKVLEKALGKDAEFEISGGGQNMDVTIGPPGDDQGAWDYDAIWKRAQDALPGWTIRGNQSLIFMNPRASVDMGDWNDKSSRHHY